MKIAPIFDKYYNRNKNFMTPKVYGYDFKEITDSCTLVFEKSEGEGLSGTPLFGCSVLVIDKWEKIAMFIDLNKSFKSKEEVDNYIDSITIKDCLEADMSYPRPF